MAIDEWLMVGVAITVYGVDQLSKYFVVTTLAEGEVVPVLGTVLQWQFVRNPGAAFSIASGMTWIFTILAAGVITFIVWFARRIRSIAWALVFGLLDRLTWGGWFHSAVAYWRYNWVQGRGALFGASPPGYYLRVLWTSMPSIAVVMVPAVLLGALRAPALATTVALFVAVHSAIPHKELRFILPVLPAAMALAGVGLAVAATRVDRRLPLGLADPACDQAVDIAGGHCDKPGGARQSLEIGHARSGRRAADPRQLSRAGNVAAGLFVPVDRRRAAALSGSLTLTFS